MIFWCMIHFQPALIFIETVSQSKALSIAFEKIGERFNKPTNNLFGTD